MRPTSNDTLYSENGDRKYLTGAERKRFLTSAKQRPQAEYLFCLCLLWTGVRISEALALTEDHIDYENGLIVIRSLKQRRRNALRIIPISPFLVDHLKAHQPCPSGRLWDWGRTKAWGVIHAIMADAQLSGVAATPRGLRHSFGVHAVMSGVPVPLLQRWMGHSKLETTTIYTHIVDDEERGFAKRMWRVTT